MRLHRVCDSFPQREWVVSTWTQRCLLIDCGPSGRNRSLTHQERGDRVVSDRTYRYKGLYDSVVIGTEQYEFR